jgi:hypothetical protein
MIWEVGKERERGRGGGGEGGRTNLDGAVENAIEANLKKGGGTGVHAREKA